MGKDQKNAFMAVMLSGLVLIIWQYFYAPQVKKAPPSDSPQTQTIVDDKTKIDSIVSNEKIDKPSVQNVLEVINFSSNERSTTFNTGLSFLHLKDPAAQFAFEDIISRGDALKIVAITDKGESPIVLSEIKRDGNKFIAVDSNLGIQFIAHYGEKGLFEYSLSSARPFRYRFEFKSEPKKLENRQVRKFIMLKDSVKSFDVGKTEDGLGTVKWAGVDFDYHLFVNIFGEKTSVKYLATEGGLFTVTTVEASNQLNGRLAYLKKNYDDLTALGDNLKLSVDFGLFHIVAVPILRGLQFLYENFHNYGLAIVVLTIFIRLLTFPLQYKSIKSMKKMQVVQPELKKIQEKYKDNPQKLQQETMLLFKKAGANPLSGCLPMLLQMPFLFAFYQVLQHAVELVNAPFYGWIGDLSVKDPYYVLPVIGTIVYLVQQKFTPSSSADPTQRKIMLMMPLVFGFIMKDLPAGLNLYMAVSAVVGILFQLFVFKTTSTNDAPVLST